MAGYIGNKSSVTLVDGYTEAEADAEFVNDPSSVITVSGSNVGIGTSSPVAPLDVTRSGNGTIAVLQTTGSHGFEISAPSSTTLQIASKQGSKNLDLWANTLSFSAGGSERMRIDSKGMVGIKHSMPSDVSGDCTSIRVGGLSTIRGVTNTTGSQNFHTGLTYNSYPTSSGADKAYVSTSGSDFKPVKYAQVAGSNIWYNASTATAGSDITWSETMRINTLGNLLVGTTSTGSGYGNNNVGINLRTTTGASIFSNSASDYGLVLNKTTYQSGSTCYQVNFRTLNQSVGGIFTDNSSTTYATSSDYRLKTDAQPMTGASARVQALNPVNFEWISDGTRVDGFLAHEAQAVVPEAIHGTKDAMRDEEYEVTPAVEATYDEDGNELTAAVEAVMGTRSVPDYQGIDQSKLVPLLTAALQEALTEIASLKTRVEALEA